MSKGDSMKRIITALALAAALALVAGCAPGVTSTGPVAAPQAEPAPAPAPVDLDQESLLRTYLEGTGSTPAEIDTQVQIGKSACEIADQDGAVEALTYLFGIMPDDERGATKAAEAIGAGFAAFCPEHSWAIDEIGSTP